MSEQFERKRAIDVLAASPSNLLAERWFSFAEKPKFDAVRRPEVGMVMVRGRAGGGGAAFNLGEATVSRASVRLETGEVGHGYCLGRDLDKVLVIAVIDALFQRDSATIEREFVDPIERVLSQRDAQRRRETEATKVEFFTMVRGDD